MLAAKKRQNKKLKTSPLCSARCTGTKVQPQTIATKSSPKSHSLLGGAGFCAWLCAELEFCPKLCAEFELCVQFCVEAEFCAAAGLCVELELCAELEFCPKFCAEFKLLAELEFSAELDFFAKFRALKFFNPKLCGV